MHVIWKRPDGFQNAQPNDFKRVSLSNGAHLWLHKHEQDWYPFQVNGDWEGQEQTKKLNYLVNMLDSPAQTWNDYLKHILDDVLESKENSTLASVAQNTINWLDAFKDCAKGHTWEVEIISCALHDIESKLKLFL